MCEAVFWGNWTEWALDAFPYAAYTVFGFPFFWLLNWNNSNKYQTRKFSYSNLIIFKEFLCHSNQYVLECNKLYFLKINHALLH
jgi:hypothetical protein